MAETYRGVPLPADAPEHSLMRGAFKLGVLAALEVAVPLLEAYVNDEPCALNHHGYCQNHGLSEAPCINTRSKEFLRAAGPEMVWRSTVTAPGLFWCYEHRPALAVVLQPLDELEGLTAECVQCGRRRKRHG